MTEKSVKTPIRENGLESYEKSTVLLFISEKRAKNIEATGKDILQAFWFAKTFSESLQYL